MKAEFLTLLEYDRWANARLTDAVAELDEEQYHCDLASSFGGIEGTLVHVCGAMQVWLHRWHDNNPSSLIQVDEVPSLDQVRTRLRELQEQVRTFVTLQSEASLGAPKPYVSMEGDSNAQPLYQQLQHLINHSSYHRGQIVTMLRQLGVQPPATDLIVFYRNRE